MANPNLKNYTSHKEWGWGGKIASANTFENVVGLPVGTNSVLKVDIYGFADDGGNPAEFTVQLHNDVGTPCCNHNGPQVSMGTDVVAGVALGGPVKIVVNANDGFKLLGRFNINEGYSLVVKTKEANTGNFLLSYSVFTS